MHRPQILRDIKNPEAMRSQFNEKLARLNELVKHEYQQKGVDVREIPVITTELFKSLRGDEYRAAARELPRQQELRRRDLVKGLGMTVVAAGLGAQAGAMVSAGIHKDRLEKLLVNSERSNSMTNEQIEKRSAEVAKILLPGVVLGGGAATYFALRSTIKTFRMQEEVNVFYTRRFLGLFARIFNLQSGEIFQLSDGEIESKLRQLKRAGCDLEEMLELLSRAEWGESLRDNTARSQLPKTDARN